MQVINLQLVQTRAERAWFFQQIGLYKDRDDLLTLRFWIWDPPIPYGKLPVRLMKVAMLGLSEDFDWNYDIHILIWLLLKHCDTLDLH